MEHYIKEVIILFYDLLFNTNDLTRVLQNRNTEIEININKEKEDYLLNVGQEQYILFLIDKFKIEPLFIKTEDAHAEVKEENVNAKYFPYGYNVYEGKSYPKEVYYFYIPFEGDKDLFNCRPSRFTFSPPRAKIDKGNIVFKFIQFREDVSEINKEYETLLNDILNYVEYVNSDIEKFNSNLHTVILNHYTKRKELILKRRQQHENLIVPLKKKSNVASTFSIPSPKVKKKISVKPIQTQKGYTPVPTLNHSEYMDILKIINDMGKEFERKPSVYKDKGEEDLRDHFLMLLEPHFEGSATGETFNKTGKTDILLRYEGTNIFVGECKFWTGQKGFLKTIDQLLGYLTWRDSKTSVIMFVKNIDFTKVVQTAKESITSHPNFIKAENESDVSWFNYTFHINGDKNNEIKLALMLYHTP